MRHIALAVLSLNGTGDFKLNAFEAICTAISFTQHFKSVCIVISFTPFVKQAAFFFC